MRYRPTSEGGMMAMAAEALAIPAALKVASGAFLVLVAVVYWRAYGPSNFLWLSDIGLALTTLAVILENRLLASMVALGVLPLEIAWTVDFLAGGRLIGLAAYMFDSGLPLTLRGLSLFHLAIPPVVVLILVHTGYDPRALAWQAPVTCAALILAYAFTDPDKNINWVFGPGSKPQHTIPPLAYLAIELTVVIGLVMVPMHFVLGYLFPPQPTA
jgi:hypothetical protein